MRRREYAHQSLAHAQWNGHFGQRRWFAGDVVLVLTHIGRVARLTGGSDIANHPLVTDFQAISFAIRAASTHSGKHHLAATLVVQVDARFQAAKGVSYFVDHVVDEFVEIENRRDSLRGFLHTLQVFHEVGGQSTNGKNLVSGGTETCSHKIQSYLQRRPEHGLPMPNQMSRGDATILSLPAQDRLHWPENAGALFPPSARGCASQCLHSWGGSTRDRADCPAGTACPRPWLRGRARTGIPGHSQGPSSGWWERCAGAAGLRRQRCARHPAERLRRRYTGHLTWARPRDTRRPEPAPDCPPACQSSRLRHGPPSLRKAHLDQPSQYLPLPCVPPGARRRGDLPRLRASGRASREPHRGRCCAPICAARKSDCSVLRRTCRRAECVSAARRGRSRR